jgi:hypothetical protein
VVNQRALDTCGSDMTVQRNVAAINGINGGFYGFLSLRGLADDLSFTSGVCGNTATTLGKEQFIEVALQPSEVLTARAINYGGEVVNLQIVDACAASSCLAGVQTSSTIGAGATLNYQAGAGPEIVYVVIDSTSTATDEPIGVEVLLRDPSCTPGQPSACQGSDIVYCSSLGTLETYPCGARGCNAGACNNPTGDVCLEALTLSGATGTVSGNFDSANPDLNPGEGRSGACFFDELDDPLGRDVVYAINLNAGDLLSAELVTTPSAATTWIYVLEDCLDERTSCVENHYASGDGNRKIAYVADVARRVFVIVDSESTTQAGPFSLSWTVTPGKTCAPNQWACVNGTTTGLCNAAGDGFVRQLTCPGACDNDACVIDQTLSDVCGTAPAMVRNAMPINSVSGGLATWIDFERGTNAVDFSAMSCLGGAAPGRDNIYRVDLAPNEILDATVTSFAAEIVGLAIVTDCAAAELSCLEGAMALGGSGRVTYQAGVAAETVYVVVDGSLSTTDEPAFIELLARAPDCTPGVTPQTCNATGDSLVYCNARGFLTEYACDGTCSNGFCDEPRADLCLDPERLNPAGTMMSAMYSVSGMLADYADDYDLTPGNSCLALSSPTNGRDAIFRLDLAAGQTANVSVTSTEATPEDLTLYVLNLNGCQPAISTCLVGADNLDASSSPETLTYTAAAAQTVYIVVDSFFAATAGSFTLDVTVQ